jgi:hypothetical protein
MDASLRRFVSMCNERVTSVFFKCSHGGMLLEMRVHTTIVAATE